MSEPTSGAARGANRSLGRPYWSLLASSGISNLSDGVRQAALPLLAVELTRDPLLVSGALASVTLPWLVLALPAGVVVDRFDRRNVMLLAQLMRATMLGLFAASIAMGVVSLPLLYAAGLAVGASEVLFNSAAQSTIPSMVPRRRLEAANGRYATAEITTDQFAGPPVGSVLFAAGMALPFLLQFGLAAAALALVAAIPGRYRPRRQSDDAPRSAVTELRHGVAWLLRHRTLRWVTLLAAMMSMVDAAGLAVLVLLWREVLAMPQAGFGLVLTAGGLGGIAGSLLAERIRWSIGTRWSLLVGVICLAGSMAGLGVTVDPWVAGLLVGVAGFAYGLWGVTSMSLRQRLTPDGLLGRVGGTHRLAALGAAPIGALFGGGVASVMGVRGAFLVGGGVLALALLVALRTLTRERVEVSVSAG